MMIKRPTKQAANQTAPSLSKTAAKRGKGGWVLIRNSAGGAGGVVRYCVQGPAGKTSASHYTSSRIIEELRIGLPVQEFNDLQAALDVPMAKLAGLLSISKATLHRRKSGQRLRPAESDRIVRFARLMGRAVQVFESEENARRWLNSPQFGLGGEAPLDYAQTEVGAREVEDLLGRIEHGVYS